MKAEQELLVWEALIYLLNSDTWKPEYQEEYRRGLLVKANSEYGKVINKIEGQ